MSGLASALGQGLSAAGYAAGDLFARGALMDAQSEQELLREQRLLEFKSGLADRERQAQAARIDTAAGEIAGQQVAGKRGLIDAGIEDRASWTPEQQAAVDQSLEADRQRLVNDPDVVLQAAAKTGDLAKKDLAMLAREDKKLEQQERLAARREQMEREREDRRDEREREREDRRDARTAASEAARDRRLGAMLAAQSERAERLASGKPPAGYRWKPDGSGTLEAIPGGPASTGKALPTKLVNDLTEQATITDSTERFQTTFDKKYAGHTVMGEASNVTGRIFGDDTGQSQWWQDYSLHEATVRNKLFGASLTTAEQGQWQKLTISPRMNPEQVKQNLDRRAEIEKKALDRLMLGASKGGYSVDQIEAVTGRPVPGREMTQTPPTSPATTQAGGGPRVPRVASEADYQKLPKGATYIAPDGSTRRK